MCGIGGVFAHGGQDAAALQALARGFNIRQAHRGPDDEDVWTDGRHCALAHRRLSIIDVSRRGRQPMADPSGRFLISFNGEIYNYRALRAGLEQQGVRFRTKTDTEVLLAGYIAHGEAVFEQLDGMFGVAIYDSRECSLLLARDRAGEKPLYYAQVGGRFTFASELRALTGLPGFDAQFDPYGLCQYLMLRYVPAPGSILKSVFQLEPGTLLRVSADGSLRTRRFFAFDRETDARPGDPIETAEAVEDALSDSILARLTAADVPVGALLSSGVDSSLVCALAARRLGRRIETFSAGFGGPADETRAASEIAGMLGLPHTSYVVTRDDLLSLVSSFGGFMDEPNGDRSCVPVYALSRELRKRVPVALSGDGGDELFCGYPRYAGPIHQLETYFDRLLPVFGSAVVSRAFPAEYVQWREDFLDRYAVLMLRAGWNDAQRLSTLDFHTYLPGAVLAKVDKMSMRHALEVRSPFFAPAVMKLAAGLAPSLCAVGQSSKPVLRALAAKYIGPQRAGARKTGFGMPASFIEANAAVFSRLLVSAHEVLSSTSFFRNRPDALSALSDAAPRNVNSLWALIVLGFWVEATGVRL